MDSREPREDHELAACPRCHEQPTWGRIHYYDEDGNARHDDAIRCLHCHYWFYVGSDKAETMARWNRRPSPVAESGEYVVDPQPEIAGAPISKIVSYNQAHEDAVEMGYPSLTEALEHLSELRSPVAESTPTDAATETYRCLACGSNNHEHRCTERKAPVEVEREGARSEKMVFAFAFAAGFKCADETSRQCASAMDDAWEDYCTTVRIAALSAPTDATAVEAEREACAKVCEQLADEGDAYERDCAGGRSWFNLKGDGQRAAAAAIRARTPKES